MNAFSLSRWKCTRLFAMTVFLALPNRSTGQTFSPDGIRYFGGKCTIAASVPLFLCPPAAVPVPDTNGPAGGPDGVIDGYDVPCNTSVDCGGTSCVLGPDTTNDTTLLCWIDVPGPIPGPLFCADVYHGAIGFRIITKGQEADGACASGGIPAGAAANAPAFWMLNTNDFAGTYTATGTMNPPWTTCFDLNPPPSAGSSIVAPAPPPSYVFPSLIDIPGIGATGQGGVFLTATDDPNPPQGNTNPTYPDPPEIYATSYLVGMHDCTVLAANDLGIALPFLCSTPGPNPGVACGPGSPCTSPSVCLDMAVPVTRQVADYDGNCGQAAGPPPDENLCP